MLKNIFFFFFLLSKMAFSCECPPITPISKEECKKYDVIFEGKVDSVSFCNEKGISTAYFFINELYEGNVLPHQKVDFDCSSACMMSFSAGEVWLMYTTYSRFDMLTVNLCGHSRKFFSDASQDHYQIAAERNFGQEKRFLQTILGKHSFAQTNEHSEQDVDLKSRNEQPSSSGKLWLLLISFATMIIVYFVTRKINKK